MFDRIRKKGIIEYICIFLFCAMCFTGCKSSLLDKQIVLTCGFNKNEVFKIEDKICTLPEVLIYLANTQNQYESVYGDELWEVSLDDVTMKDSVKSNVLAHISQIKAMNKRAEEMGIFLDAEEENRVSEAASEYYGSLSETEIDSLMVSQEIVEKMYSEYALAYKFYVEVIKDINPEISDDEARTITVEQIFIKTYTIGENSNMVSFSEEAQKRAYNEAVRIHEMAISGEYEFEDLVAEYSEGDKTEYSFGKGDMEPAFEEAAFNLGKDEISGVVETKYGYHIIKCINTFNREETDANKVKMAEKDRQEVFGVQYDEFASTLTTYLNEELWNSIELFENEEIRTQNFFEIYHKYFM